MKTSTERIHERFSRPPGCRSYGPEGQAAKHAKIFNRRDAEYAEDNLFCLSGDDDKQKHISGFFELGGLGVFARVILSPILNPNAFLTAD